MKKIISIITSVVLSMSIMICFATMSFASGKQTINLGVKKSEDKIVVDVYVDDAEGLESLASPLYYDSSVLQADDYVKHGAFVDLYNSVGETTYALFGGSATASTEGGGIIIPGIILMNHIYSDAEFTEICEKNEVENTISTSHLLMYEVTFTVIDDTTKTTTITCDNAKLKINLIKTEEKTTVEETTTEEVVASDTDAEETTIADEPTTIVTEETTIIDETTTSVSGNEAAGSVETGDNTALGIATGIALLAAIAFAVAYKVKKH